MAIEKSAKEKYLNSLTQNYMDKLFYFSLKKTGNSFEAENLAQDILFNVVTSLERGNKPETFEAWVWGIARNRYNVWARNGIIETNCLLNRILAIMKFQTIQLI